MHSLFDIYKHCVLDLRMDAQNPKDFSGHGNDGTGVGIDNTNIVSGVRGGDKGLNFNGSNEYVDMVDSSFLNLGSNLEFTLLFHLNFSNKNTQILLDKRSESGSGLFIFYSFVLQLVFNSTSISFNDIVPQKDLFIIMSSNHRTKHAISINGSILEKNTDVTNINTNNQIVATLGSRSFSKPALTFNGNIYRFLVFNTAIYPIQHKWLYESIAKGKF